MQANRISIIISCHLLVRVNANEHTCAYPFQISLRKDRFLSSKFLRGEESSRQRRNQRSPHFKTISAWSSSSEIDMKVRTTADHVVKRTRLNLAQLWDVSKNKCMKKRTSMTAHRGALNNERVSCGLGLVDLAASTPEGGGGRTGVTGATPTSQ